LRPRGGPVPVVQRRYPGRDHLLHPLLQGGGAAACRRLVRDHRLLLDRRLLQCRQPHRWPRRPCDHADRAGGLRAGRVRLRLGTRAVRRIPADPARARRRRAGDHLRGHRRGRLGLPLVQHLSGNGVHGRHRRACPGRGARQHRRDRAPGAGAGGDGRHLRDRDAVGDHPGGVVQAHRQARVPDGADPPPLRTQGLAGAARDRALLDHLGDPGAGRPGHVEGALMDRTHDRGSQAVRLESIGGRFDPWMLGAVLGLGALGIVMVGSSSIGVGDELGVGPYYFLIRHVVFMGLGAALAFWAMRTELKTIERFDRLLLVGCFLALLLVFVPGIGSSVNGAQRWINLGVSKFQAVEAVKVMYIVWLASYLVRFRDEVNATWGAMLKPIGVAIVLMILLALQPDFGSLALLLAITAGMLVLGGVHLPRMAAPVLLLLPILAIVAIAEPYRMRRLTSFMDPFADPFNSGYQLANALMAVGRGEFWGVGLGASIQKLNYLPEAHTDFILAVIAEELGFVGVCLVIGLYALLVGRAFL